MNFTGSVVGKGIRVGGRRRAKMLLVSAASVTQDEDPYLWLEEVENAEALEWASKRSAEDTALLEAIPEYETIHEELLKIYNSSERIPF